MPAGDPAADDDGGEPSDLAVVRADGRVTVRAAGYALTVEADGRTARLGGLAARGAAGGHQDGTSPAAAADGEVARLTLLGALDCAEGPDETMAVGRPVVVTTDPYPVIEVERDSTRWERAVVRLVCRPDAVELTWSVRGTGTLTEVHLLAGRSVAARGGSGFLPSGSRFRTLFSPNPGDPRRLVRPAGESAVVGVVGDARPGRGHWFFTPAPLCLALTTAPRVADPGVAVEQGWWTLGLGAPVDELTFTQLAYLPGDGAFSLRLDYEGHTRVDGAYRTPALLLTPGHPDPYRGLRRHRDQLAEAGWAPPVTERPRSAWWSAPMFCGWGAQSHDGAVAGRPAQELATQESYDRYLAHLAEHGVTPCTVVIDDKWQQSYGGCRPDPAKWPDLPGWIARRHQQGQRVLLWWPAWLWEGLPDELAVRNPRGEPVALDPSNPAALDALAEGVTRMLAPVEAGGLGADGLKIDFTARTPSGTALSRHGRSWGIALLHRMLAAVYAAAKAANPEALVITHAPHPAFVDVTDMVRLNDMLRLDDPEPDAPIVPQMRHRAAVATASCPELLVDTDDWCVPDRLAWRAYLDVKPQLGVPALYYATHIDRTGEPLRPEDYRAVCDAWRSWQNIPRDAQAARDAAPTAPPGDGPPARTVTGAPPAAAPPGTTTPAPP